MALGTGCGFLGSNISRFSPSLYIPAGITEITGLVIGQSLAGGLSSSQESGSDAGEVSLNAKITEITGLPASLINSASGGSYALQKSEPSTTNYWMNDDLSPNTLATDAVSDASGTTINYILDGQGEADSFRIPANTTEAEYKAAKLALYNYLRAQLGDVPIFIQRSPGRRIASNSSGEAGAVIIRRVYSQLIAENDFLYDGAELYDLTLIGDVVVLEPPDNVHIADVSQGTLGARNGAAIASQAFGGSAPWEGPRITAIDRQDLSTSVRIWISVTQEGDATYEGNPSSGVNLLPSSNKVSQFRVFVDGAEVVPDGFFIFISNGSSRDQNIRLTFNDKTLIPESSVVEIYNFHGNGLNLSSGDLIDLDEIIHDSNGLPLRTAYWREDADGLWEDLTSA